MGSGYCHARRLVGLPRCLFALRLLLLFLAVLLFFFFLLVFFLGVLFAFVIIAWRQKGRHIRAQRDCDQPESVRVNPGVIEVAIDWRELTARFVKQIFAFAIKHRFIVVVIPP